MSKTNINNDGSVELTVNGGIYNRGFSDTEDVHKDGYGNDINGVLTEKALEQKFSYKKVKSDNALKSSVNYMKKYYKPSGNCMKNFFFARFPFFEWILTYDIKQNLVKDLIAGLTVIKLNRFIFFVNCII